MKKLYGFLNPFLALCVSFGLVGCGGDSQTPPEAQEVTATEKVVQAEYVEEDVLDFVLPSPLQTASILKRSGLVYVEGLTNPLDNVSKYNTSFSKMCNFGLYSADLSYCILNGQSQQGLNYMKVVKDLSDEIGLSSIFNSKELFDSFESNLGNEDSMIYILATVQEHMDEFMEESEQEYMSIIIFTGAWVEGMYLGANMDTDDNAGLYRRLIEQMVILDNLIIGLNKYPSDNEEVDQLVQSFEEVRAIYLSFDAIKDHDLDDIAFEEIVLSKEELKRMTDKIKEIRNTMAKS